MLSGVESSKRETVRTLHMLIAIIVTLIITAALGYALRAGKHGGAIARRPYNNRYNDASGARDYGLFE
jgi:hypothetical protein